MQEFVIKAVQQLVAQGKTPTVALIKGKLCQPVAMPVIINVLNQYKKDPSSIILQDVDDITAAEPSINAEQQTQLDRIEAKLDRLLTMLEVNR